MIDVFHLDVQPFLGAFTVDHSVPTGLKGDNQAPIFATFPAASATKGDGFLRDSVVIPTKGDVQSTFLAASASKGDVFMADSCDFCDVDVDMMPVDVDMMPVDVDMVSVDVDMVSFSHESSHFAPCSHAHTQYLGKSLTEINQLE